MNIKSSVGLVKKYLSDLFLILKAALKNFQKKGAARGAAGMAYYTLLSFFPLLSVLVTIGSYFIDSAEASSKVGELIISVIPVSQNFVELNIQRIQVLRNSVGVVSLIVFIWSGSNAFSMMVHHITSAWPETEQRTFFQKRLFGLAMVILIILLLFVSMLSSTVLNALVKYRELIPGLEFFLHSWLWHFGAKILYWVVPFLFFYSVYRIIPMGRVPIKSCGIQRIGNYAVVAFGYRDFPMVFRKWICALPVDIWISKCDSGTAVLDLPQHYDPVFWSAYLRGQFWKSTY